MSNLNKMSLARAVDETLFYVWDPIGISTMPEARDEYASYVPQVVEALRSGASEAQIARLLGVICTTRMGLPHVPRCCAKSADTLIRWRLALKEEEEDGTP